MRLHDDSTRRAPLAARRRFIRQAGFGGLLALSPIERLFAMAGRPPAQGVIRIEGEARINGRAASQGDPIAPGDVVETGPGARVVYVVGRSAFLQRGDSRVEIGDVPASNPGEDQGLVIQALRILAGKLLSVHARGELGVETSFGSIGIRGTGLYVDVQAGRTYVCICYGVADLLSKGGERLETVRTRHHESPRYLYPDGSATRIEKAPVVDHTDDELIMLESLVKREPPFVEDDLDRNY